MAQNWVSERMAMEAVAVWAYMAAVVNRSVVVVVTVFEATHSVDLFVVVVRWEGPGRMSVSACMACFVALWGFVAVNKAFLAVGFAVEIAAKLAAAVRTACTACTATVASDFPVSSAFYRAVSYL